MKTPVAHEITLIAWGHEEGGARVVMDIVETSYRNASKFARQWYRMAEIHEISAERPNVVTLNVVMHPIVRAPTPRPGLLERVKREVFAAAVTPVSPERDARLAYWHERRRNADRAYWRTRTPFKPTKAERAARREIAKAGNWCDSADARAERRQLGCDA